MAAEGRGNGANSRQGQTVRGVSNITQGKGEVDEGSYFTHNLNIRTHTKFFCTLAGTDGRGLPPEP